MVWGLQGACYTGVTVASYGLKVMVLISIKDMFSFLYSYINLSSKLDTVFFLQ